MPFNTLFSWLIKKRIHQIDLFKKYPLEVQNEVFTRLISAAIYTEFGFQNNFFRVKNLLLNNNGSYTILLSIVCSKL